MRYITLVLSTVALYAASYLLAPSQGNADNDPLLIIANKSVAQNTITQEEVRFIFLKERANWSGGGKAVPVNAKSGTARRKAFQSKVLGMDASEETAYWQKQKITRGATPPPEFADVQKAIFSLKGKPLNVFGLKRDTVYKNEEL